MSLGGTIEQSHKPVPGPTGIELSKGATPILLLILLPQSNLESKSKNLSKSKRQGITP